jgi:hypothetical protein
MTDRNRLMCGFPRLSSNQLLTVDENERRVGQKDTPRRRTVSRARGNAAALR